ncbi:MAG: beta-lactamase family protein [Deltaproteobacteria bacterium]|nr:beta-lactamase family protein [Deltaproteobacteria bacterium]
MADIVELIGRWDVAALSRCRIPEDPTAVIDRGPEDSPRAAGTTRKAIEEVWGRVDALYRSGVHPAIQICVRRGGAVALNRAIGHARGNAPDEPEDTPKVPITTQTPINLFSAAKAVTAMLIHKLDERGLLHLDDRVSEFIPEFARHDKERITLRHVVAHRAGIPNLPPDSMNLDLLASPELVIERLCDLKPVSQPGRLLAYHAVSGGFLLAEVVQRITGRSLRDLLAREIREPLGLRWLHYGVPRSDIGRVAENAFTGPPVPPLLSTILTRALGTDLTHVCEMSNDPRFITGLIPSANLFTTAQDAAAFYQCLLDEGELDGVRVFEPRTVHHAIDEQSSWEVDLTLGLPIAYSTGFMLGNRYLSLYGWNHPRAFGHLGLTNIFCWADPERELAAAILTTGKPVLSLHAVRMAQLHSAIHAAFPPRRKRRQSRRRRQSASHRRAG